MRIHAWTGLFHAGPLWFVAAMPNCVPMVGGKTMADQVIIAVEGRETAEVLQRDLDSQGIRVRSVGHAQGLAFTGRFWAGPVGADVTPKEIFEIVGGDRTGHCGCFLQHHRKIR